MIITLFILLIILIHTLGIGHFVLKQLKASDQENVILTSLIGSFFIMLLLGTLHFFVPISGLVFLIISCLSSYGFYLFIKQDNFPSVQLTLTQKLMLLTSLFYLIIRATLYPSWTDSNLYHAQVIQWYNTYPITKGIANLFCAYGLNSNFHLFASLYTFTWVGTDINIPNVAIFYYQVLFCVFLILKIEKAPILGVILLWFFVAFWGWESSPSPDTVVTILIVMAGILFIDQNEKPIEILFLLLVGIFSFTLKQSAFIFLFLTPYIIYKNRFSVSFYSIIVGIGIFTYFLWIFRNLILSGYPLYPLISFDFIELQHKVPKDLVEAWTIQVTHFARRPIDSWKEVIGQSFNEWFPYWFNLHRKTDRLLMVFTLINICLVFFKKKNHKVIISVIAFALCFWLFKVSTMRFAYGYMFILIYLMYHTYYQKVIKNTISFSVVFLFTVGNIYSLAKDFSSDQIIIPEDYQKTSYKSYTIDKQEVRVPFSDTNCKNTVIPCMYLPPESTLKMFTDKLSDGFYQSVPSKIDIDKRGY